MSSFGKFTGTLKAPSIAKNLWQQELNSFLQREIKAAATVWLNATVLSVIPVWSGAAQGTFLKLAQSVGFPLTITGIRAPAGSHPRALGVQVGFQQSTGEVTDVRNGKVSFSYGTSLFHLVFNESRNANQSPEEGRLFARLIKPGPYNFREIGQEAFRQYTSSLSLPPPWPFLQTKTLRI